MQNLKHKVDNAKCLAVIDLVFILPKTTAPAWTMSCKDDALYDLKISDIFSAIYYWIYG